MGWKAMEFYTRKEIGAYPDAESMAEDLRWYGKGFRFILDDGEGKEFEAVMDDAAMKIVSDSPLVVYERDVPFGKGAKLGRRARGKGLNL